MEKTHPITCLYGRYHLDTPRIHGIFPFRKTLRNNRLSIEFLHKIHKNFKEKTQLWRKKRVKEMIKKP